MKNLPKLKRIFLLFWMVLIPVLIFVFLATHYSVAHEYSQGSLGSYSLNRNSFLRLNFLHSKPKTQISSQLTEGSAGNAIKIFPRLNFQPILEHFTDPVLKLSDNINIFFQGAQLNFWHVPKMFSTSTALLSDEPKTTSTVVSQIAATQSPNFLPSSQITPISTKPNLLVAVPSILADTEIANSSLILQHQLFKKPGALTLYLFKDGSLHLVPDLPTLGSLGFRRQDAYEVSAETFALFKIGEPVGTIISPFSKSEIKSIQSLIQQFLKEVSLATNEDAMGQSVFTTLQKALAEIAVLKNSLTRHVPQNDLEGNTNANIVVGGGNANVDGSQGTFGNIRINSNTINTTSGKLTISSMEGPILLPSSLTINSIAYTFPSADGSSGQFLKTNGSRTLSWATASGGGGLSNIGVREGTAAYSHIVSMSFDAGGFNISNMASVSTVKFDYINGPASRSTAQTISGGWTFNTSDTTFSGINVGFPGTSRFTSGGNIGIGTTSPLTKLELKNGTASVSMLVTAGAANFALGNVATLAYSRFGSSTTTHSNWISTASDLFLSNDLGGLGSISFAGPASISNTLWVSPGGFNGNVGIGIRSPTQQLHLAGETAPTIRMQNGIATEFSDLDIVIDSTAARFVANGLDISFETNPNAADAISGTQILRIKNSSGYVGIGTNNPLTKLNVKGTASISAEVISGALNAALSNVATVAYSRFGTSTTSRSLSAASDLLVSGKLEIVSSANFNNQIVIKNTLNTSSVASISATSLTTGNVLQITVPASTSGGGAYFLVKDASNNVYASLSSGGKFSIRRTMFSRGAATTNCTGVGVPSAGCVDYAESYPTQDNTIEAGDIIAINLGQENLNVIKSSKPYDGTMLGVVSSNPAVLITNNNVKLGDEANNFKETGTVPVALAGRVPVKFSNENGEIKKGDYLTSSSKPGIAMKATKSGRVVGIALENSHFLTGQTATVMILINPHWAGQELDANGQLADFSGKLSLLYQNSQNIVSAVLAYLKEAVVSVRELLADKVTTKQLCLGETCVTEDQLKGLLKSISGDTPTDNLQQGGGNVLVVPSLVPTPTPEPNQVPTPSPLITPQASKLISPSILPAISPTLSPAVEPILTPASISSQP